MTALYEPLSGTVVKRLSTERIRKDFNAMLVTEMIRRLDPSTMRQILINNGLKPNSHNNKLLGQVKTQILENKTIELTAIYDALTTDEDQIPLYDPKVIVEHITSLQTKPRKELEGIYKRLTKKEFDKSQNKKRLINVVQKGLIELFVSKFPDLTGLINAMGGWAESEENHSQQAINLIHKQIGKKDGKDKLKTFVDSIPSIRKTGPPTIPAAAEPMELENDGDSATNAPSSTGMTSDKARTLLVTEESWKQFSYSQVKILYKQLGSKAKTFPQREKMIESCRTKTLSIVISQLQPYVVRLILKDFNITPPKGHSESVALRKHALTNPDVMETLGRVYDDWRAGKTITDLDPTNRFIRERNQKNLQALRRELLHRRNNGSMVVYPNDGVDNQIIQAGKEVEAELASIEFQFCTVCHERRPGSGVNPKTGRCQRCDQEKPKDNLPYKYSLQNNMIPGPQPPELANLTLVEQVCIARAHTQTRVVNLRGGGTRMKGSSISFAQDVGEFYKKLPSRPEDLPIVFLKTSNQQVKMKANRHRIQRALQWLVANNKYYKNLVEISTDNLIAYPDDYDGFVENLRVLESDEAEDETPKETATNEEAETAMTVDDETEHHGEECTSDPAGTFVHHEIPLDSTRNNIEAVLHQLETENAARNLSDSPQPVTLDMPTKEKSPLSEFRTEGFFTMCYPHLFPTGAGDITATSDLKVEMKDSLREFADHLIWLAIEGEEQNRFAADPRFIFHVVNMFQRHTALKLGNVMADRICEDKSVAEITEALEDPSHALTKCLNLLSGQIPGSDAFFKSHRKKANATEKAMRIFTKNTERFNFFLTLRKSFKIE